MVLGEPIILGGGTSLMPEIIITAKAGATLNLHYTGSAVILQTYTLGASETTHTFQVEVSATKYVVTDATNNVDSSEILVDEIGQYSVTIEYKLYLYNEGDGCTSVTGGWSAWYDSVVLSYQTGIVFTKSASYMTFGTSNNHNYYYDWLNVLASNTINLTGYSSLNIDFITDRACVAAGAEITWTRAYICIGTKGSNQSKYQGSTSKSVDLTGVAKGVSKSLTLDISSYQSSYNVWVKVYSGSRINITKIWLE